MEISSRLLNHRRVSLGVGGRATTGCSQVWCTGLDSDGFKEEGGAAALRVHGGTTDTTFTTLGVHLSSAFDIGGRKAKAHGTLSWRHAFGDTTPLSSHAFAGSGAFSVAGVPIAEDAAIIEAGLDFDITPAATLGIAYQGQIASDARQHGFKADLTVRF